ncbi:MAG: hypothetical protein KME43_21385 [Myxacorys chilensis ATA2-1-KO14]|nr:hypothetical protein [Myxacorys chilensis ATA2-1-KO14]
MDALTLDFDALQRLSEALPKKGALLSLRQSWFEEGEELADVTEETASYLDAIISYVSPEWNSLSDEDRAVLKSLAEYAQTTLEQIEESNLLTRLLLLIPSIRRRKNLYKLLRQSNERLVSTISTMISAWEAEREREFEEAASYVVKKNAELYRRLA